MKSLSNCIYVLFILSVFEDVLFESLNYAKPLRPFSKKPRERSDTPVPGTTSKQPREITSESTAIKSPGETTSTQGLNPIRPAHEASTTGRLRPISRSNSLSDIASTTERPKPKLIRSNSLPEITPQTESPIPTLPRSNSQPDVDIPSSTTDQDQDVVSTQTEPCEDDITRTNPSNPASAATNTNREATNVQNAPAREPKAGLSAIADGNTYSAVQFLSKNYIYILIAFVIIILVGGLIWHFCFSKKNPDP